MSEHHEYDLLVAAYHEVMDERDTLQSRLDNVKALKIKWDKDWASSGSNAAAGAIRNCTFELLQALSGTKADQ